jgi:hypothetical protein
MSIANRRCVQAPLAQAKAAFLLTFKPLSCDQNLEYQYSSSMASLVFGGVTVVTGIVGTLAGSSISKVQAYSRQGRLGEADGMRLPIHAFAVCRPGSIWSARRPPMTPSSAALACSLRWYLWA